MKARKRFGQNFLHDPQVIRHIVQTLSPAAGENIIEIGPGHGALTEHLVAADCHLTVIEIDRDLAAEIALRYGEQLQIISADVLTVDFSSLPHPARIIGNLPYNISTPLLFRLFAQLDCVVDGTFMLQDEVVNRLVAEPGGRDYGRLSVMAQYHCEFSKEFTVGPGAFRPQPKVTSAIVTMVPHRDRLACTSTTLLEQLVTAAFGQRRKTLRNALKKYLSAEQLEALGINPGQRPETLTVADYVACTNYLASIS